MKNVNEHIERLIRYLNGEIGNKEAKALRSEMADDTELADLLEVVKNLLQQGQTFKTMSLGKASKQLSRQIFKDFKRSQKARKFNYGINIFDSKILPIAFSTAPIRRPPSSRAMGPLPSSSRVATRRFLLITSRHWACLDRSR